ncbi:hypothetical protein V6N13_043563 [Hibiscus sabdariffa]
MTNPINELKGTAAGGFLLSDHDHDHDNGCPPETMTTIPVLQPLERMGSPLAAEDLREAKKDRHKRDSPFDLDGSDAREMDTDGLPATGLVESDSPELLLGEDSERPELAARASYASVVHDASMYNKQAEDVLDLTLDKLLEQWLRHAKEFCAKISPRKDPEGVIIVPKPDTTDVPIANKEPGELFGPWMTVDNRRRRPLNKSSSGRNKALMDSMAEGSRFAILESVVPEVTPTIVADTEVPPSSNVIARKASGPSSSSTVGAELPHGVRKNAAYLASNPPRKSKAVVSPVSHPEVLSMVSGAHKEDGLPAVSSLDDEGGDAVMDQLELIVFTFSTSTSKDECGRSTICTRLVSSNSYP